MRVDPLYDGGISRWSTYVWSRSHVGIDCRDWIDENDIRIGGRECIDGGHDGSVIVVVVNV